MYCIVHVRTKEQMKLGASKGQHLHDMFLCSAAEMGSSYLSFFNGESFCPECGHKKLLYYFRATLTNKNTQTASVCYSQAASLELRRLMLSLDIYQFNKLSITLVL